MGWVSRFLGTISAFEIGDGAGDYLSILGPTLKAGCFERHVHLRPLGNTVYVMPPYCIDDFDLDAVYEAILDVSIEATGAFQMG